MDSSWKRMFRDRMEGFESLRPAESNEVAASIKIRVVGGCFHREHSPQAYDLIDQHLETVPREPREFVFVEHESGPELLVYLAVATAGLTLAKSVVELITAIVKARSEGIRRGDRPSSDLELIVRRVAKAGEVREERILRVSHMDRLDATTVAEELEKSAQLLLEQDDDDTA